MSSRSVELNWLMMTAMRMFSMMKDLRKGCQGGRQGAWARRYGNLFMVSLCIYFSCILFLLFKTDKPWDE